MSLTRAEARRQKKQTAKEIATELARAAKAKLDALRAALRQAKRLRMERVREAVRACKAARTAHAERARERRRALLEALRRELKDERHQARAACAAGKRAARQATDAGSVEQVAALFEAERAYQADLRRLESGNRARRLEARRATAAEQRSESDGEVLANIPPEYAALFERVKRSIKGSARQSRTEAFLRYVEEHPSEVFASIDAETDRKIREMEKAERSLARGVRTRRRYTAAELAEVPF